MKNLSSLLLVILLGISYQSCDNSNTEVLEKNEITEDDNGFSDKYFAENISLVDARIKKISAKEYARELVFIDFEGTIDMPTGMSFNDEVYMDNGIGFDAVKGDHVFTSVIDYKYDEKSRYSKHDLISLLEEPIVNTHFVHQFELQNFESSYERIGNEGFYKEKNKDKGSTKAGIELECDIEWRNCSHWNWECLPCVVSGWTIGGCIWIGNCSKIIFGI